MNTGPQERDVIDLKEPAPTPRAPCRKREHALVRHRMLKAITAASAKLSARISTASVGSAAGAKLAWTRAGQAKVWLVSAAVMISPLWAPLARAVSTVGSIFQCATTGPSAPCPDRWCRRHLLNLRCPDVQHLHAAPERRPAGRPDTERPRHRSRQRHDLCHPRRVQGNESSRPRTCRTTSGRPLSPSRTAAFTTTMASIRKGLSGPLGETGRPAEPVRARAPSRSNSYV